MTYRGFVLYVCRARPELWKLDQHGDADSYATDCYRHTKAFWSGYEGHEIDGRQVVVADTLEALKAEIRQLRKKEQ